MIIYGKIFPKTPIKIVKRHTLNTEMDYSSKCGKIVLVFYLNNSLNNYRDWKSKQEKHDRDLNLNAFWMQLISVNASCLTFNVTFNCQITV